MPRRLPYQVSKAPQLAPFELSHLGEALSKPATLPHRKEPAEVLSLRQRPDTLQRKLISATCSFSVYPELVTIGLCPHLRGWDDLFFHENEHQWVQQAGSFYISTPALSYRTKKLVIVCWSLSRCSPFKVLQGHRTVDSHGNLCLHWWLNGGEGRAENNNMGAVFTPGGAAKQVW